jgi:hypothetical protein
LPLLIVFAIIFKCCKIITLKLKNLVGRYFLSSLRFNEAMNTIASFNANCLSICGLLYINAY